MSYHQTPDGKDPQLWDIARRRASFKSHLTSYIIVNLFLWGMWFFTSGKTSSQFPWPIWSSLGWGIGLAFHYVGAYVISKSNAIENEYEKLIRQKTNINQ